MELVSRFILLIALTSQGQQSMSMQRRKRIQLSAKSTAADAADDDHDDDDVDVGDKGEDGNGSQTTKQPKPTTKRRWRQQLQAATSTTTTANDDDEDKTLLLPASSADAVKRSSRKRAKMDDEQLQEEEEQFEEDGNFTFGPRFKPFAVIKGGKARQLNLAIKKGKECRRLLKEAKQLPTIFIDGQGHKIVPFFRHCSPFSNFYPSPFQVDQWGFCCSEQFYHFCKALTFDDQATAEAVMQTEKPAEMKRLGRRVNGFDVKHWDLVSILTMVIGLTRKFQQNEAIRRDLLATDGAELIEASPFDGRWGAKMSEKRIVEGQQRWKGRNFLGRILQAVRSHLLTASDDDGTVNFTLVHAEPHFSIPHPNGRIPYSPIHPMATQTELRMAEALVSELVDN